MKLSLMYSFEFSNAFRCTEHCRFVHVPETVDSFEMRRSYFCPNHALASAFRTSGNESSPGYSGNVKSLPSSRCSSSSQRLLHKHHSQLLPWHLHRWSGQGGCLFFHFIDIGLKVRKVFLTVKSCSLPCNRYPCIPYRSEYCFHDIRQQLFQSRQQLYIPAALTETNANLGGYSFFRWFCGTVLRYRRVSPSSHTDKDLHPHRWSFIWEECNRYQT